MTDENVTNAAEASSQGAAPEPAAPVLTDAEKERITEEQVAKQRQGDTGIIQPAKPEEEAPDPRAAKRAELLRQLAALDEQAPDFAAMSDKELSVRFLTALHQHLGSHPKLDGVITELLARSAKQ